MPSTPSMVASTPGFFEPLNSAAWSSAQVARPLRYIPSSSKPSGNCSSITEPSGNGKFCMLRGSEISTVLPVSASMLATVIESGRRPQRPAPASPPMSSTL